VEPVSELQKRTPCPVSNGPLPARKKTGPPRKYCSKFCCDKATRTYGRARAWVALDIDDIEPMDLDDLTRYLGLPVG
jgi:hypothetical protein